MSTKRFRCCKKTQNGDFCTHCGKGRPEDGALEGITELRAYLETKRDSALQTAETLRGIIEADKKAYGEDWTGPGCAGEKFEGWIRRAEHFDRYLKSVNTLAKLAP